MILFLPYIVGRVAEEEETALVKSHAVQEVLEFRAGRDIRREIVHDDAMEHPFLVD